jgi:integrase
MGASYITLKFDCVAISTATAIFSHKDSREKMDSGYKAAIRDGRYKGLSAARKHTVGELIDRFIEQCVPQHPIYYPKKVQLLLRWKQELGSMLLRDLSPLSIAEVRDKLLSETTTKKTIRCPGTVNRYLALFSRALSVAFKEWEWMDDNPMQKVRKLKESKGRDRCLSAAKRMSLLASDSSSLISGSINSPK